jgi:nitroreductase
MTITSHHTSVTAIHPLLAERRSTRAFDRSAVLDETTALRLLEAARWSASGGNSQPWRFVLAPRGTEEYATLFAALNEGNQIWAGDASALLLAVAVTVDEGKVNDWAPYDLGQAVAQLVVQAQHEGLAVHQMGGFDPDLVVTELDLPTGMRPYVIAAVGAPSDRIDHLPEFLQQRETAPRTRRPLEELLVA